MSKTIKDLMTKSVISVTAETNLIEASKLLTKNHFNGIPVVDKENKLVGLITEYDLITSETAMHLPTLQLVLDKIPVFSKDKGDFKKKTSQIKEMRVLDVMNSNPLTLLDSATLEETLKTFQDHHRVNPVIVVNDKNQLVGVVSRFDLVKLLHI
ncbi:MAG: hypothetical protein COU06_01880 [Candidatus Harrisonbacteria bacterium CG10_big_fil_rev_8_21_14_0_10_38_8]|uniref:CBS domain-containing protein n=1 Tax=Candidatus Harrisonbacteria bacterium CG10_big_fil_rev_8_21_14_0_10_38_8 TaxID=1974582 RepID=A0A2M6WJW4_9BACT|nr:MAG: hypothetical protein COU06_01880 [Candidatus Harrisonbacteria bacterium CG10_big_fil_rev_8_21_14_0_10_38_8]